MSTPNMNLTKPTVLGDVDAWGTELNSIFDLVDAHDHTTGKGVAIPAAGLGIDGDVNWSSGGTAHAITHLRCVEFQGVTNGTVNPTYPGCLYLDSSDNELHYQDSSLRDIRITNAGALNVAAFVGGIGGDYASVGALEKFDDATDSYWFQQQLVTGVRAWAGMRSGNVDIYEQAASITNRVRLKSPAALAASYDVTLWTALPASTSAVQLSSAGALTASNTFANAMTFSSTVNLGTAVAAFTATGLATFSAGVTSTAGTTTLGVTTATTLTASTDYKHSFTATAVTPASDATPFTPAAFNSSANDEAAYIVLGTSTSASIYPIRVKVGDRIKTIRLYATKSSPSGTITATLRKFVYNAGASSSIASNTITSNPGNTVCTIASVNYTALSTEQYYLRVTGGGTTGDFLYHVEIDYDRP